MELMGEAFLLVNILWTTLLMVVVVYWLTVVFGAMDVDFLDVDWDAETTFDVDVEVEGGDSDGGVNSLGGWLRGVLSFFYVGEIPVMVLVSLMLLAVWVVSILGNYYLNPGRSLLLAPVVYAVAIATGLATVKVFGWPFRKLFGMLDRENKEQSRPLVGRMCRIDSSQVTSERLGQAMIETAGAPVLLNVKCAGEDVLKKGDEAIITGRDAEKDIYFIEPVDLEN